MAYEIPTAADLIARYPAFAAVAVATIDVHIADAAASSVDESWFEADYALAISAKAAHEMALLGLGDHGEAAGYAAAGVTSVKSGNFQASFSAEKVKAASGGKLDATPYGQTYKRLLHRNKGGPRVVALGGEAVSASPFVRLNNGQVYP